MGIEKSRSPFIMSSLDKETSLGPHHFNEHFGHAGCDFFISGLEFDPESVAQADILHDFNRGIGKLADPYLGIHGHQSAPTAMQLVERTSPSLEMAMLDVRAYVAGQYSLPVIF